MQSAAPSQLALTNRFGSLQDSLAGKTLLVVGATAFVAACAHISLPLPFTPVPLTLQNFAVLIVGMLLGPIAGFSAIGPLPRRRRPGPAGLHPVRCGRRRTPPRPQRRFPLFLPAGRSNCRLGCACYAAYDHELQKRPRRLNRSHAPHFSLRRRLVGPLASSWNLCNMVARSRSLRPWRNRQDHRCSRYLQHSPALASALIRGPESSAPSPRRAMT